MPAPDAPPTTSASSEPDRIPITQLAPQELVNLRESVEADLERLANSHIQLGRLAQRFVMAEEAIKEMAQAKEGQPLLLPLTGSLYVSGELADTQHVLLDIGTGYFLEADIEAGTDYCRRKHMKLKDNMDVVMQARQEKRAALIQINQLLQQKVAAMAAQQGER